MVLGTHAHPLSFTSAKIYEQLYSATGVTIALVAMIPDSNICIEY